MNSPPTSRTPAQRPRRGLPTVVALAALAAPHSDALAGAVLSFSDDQWVSANLRFRASYNGNENPAGNDWSTDARFDSIELLMNASLNRYVKFSFDLEKFDGEHLRVLDAIGRFEYSRQFNVWGGRMLPPSDRANLAGPYYLGTWNYPFVSNYPAIFLGRDNAAAVWGTTALGPGHLNYRFGAGEGCAGGARCDTGANRDNHLLYSARLTYNLWDDEPGYYLSSDYFGTQDVLAIGLVGQYQTDAVGTAGNAENFFGWNIDALLNKRLAGGGAVNLEGAFYQYNAGADPANRGGLYDGNAWLALAGYLLPDKLWIGRLQPHLRYQYLDNNQVGKTRQWEAGLNYIIDGHNARVSAVFGSRNDDLDGGADTDSKFFNIGLQIQL